LSLGIMAFNDFNTFVTLPILSTHCKADV